jgi:hypothetical protein
MSEQELRTRKVYRWTFAAGLALVMALTIWLALPPSPVDLRFLNTLHPTKSAEGGDSHNFFLTYKQMPAEVEKLLDIHLNAKTHWRKSTAPGSYTLYVGLGRAMPSLTVSPNYASGPPTAGIPTVHAVKVSRTKTGYVKIPPTPPPPAVVGTTVSIDDPRGIAVLH